MNSGCQHDVQLSFCCICVHEGQSKFVQSPNSYQGNSRWEGFRCDRLENTGVHEPTGCDQHGLTVGAVGDGTGESVEPPQSPRRVE